MGPVSQAPQWLRQARAGQGGEGCAGGRGATTGKGGASAGEVASQRTAGHDNRPCTTLGYDIRERRTTGYWGLPSYEAPHRREAPMVKVRLEKPTQWIRPPQVPTAPPSTSGGASSAHLVGGGGAGGPAGAGTGAEALASSSPLMTASKLKAPGDEEQEKFLQEVYVTEASTGGNGIRRPYGLFIATRNGNGKSLWTRLPAPRQRNYSSPGPPPATAEGARGKNVSQFNVGRGEYTKRNMSLDRKKIRSSYGFKGEDTVRRCTTEINTPREDRPFWDATKAIQGRQWGGQGAADGGGGSGPGGAPSPASAGARAGAGAEEGRGGRRLSRAGYSFPAATFLTEIPAVPSAVRVDCGAVTAIQHMHPDYLSAKASQSGTPA